MRKGERSRYRATLPCDPVFTLAGATFPMVGCRYHRSLEEQQPHTTQAQHPSPPNAGGAPGAPCVHEHPVPPDPAGACMRACVSACERDCEFAPATMPPCSPLMSPYAPSCPPVVDAQQMCRKPDTRTELAAPRSSHFMHCAAAEQVVALEAAVLRLYGWGGGHHVLPATFNG